RDQLRVLRPEVEDENHKRGGLLESVIGRLFRDVDVVDVALLQPGGRDADELRVATEIAERPRPEVSHACAQATDELLHDERERPLVRDASLDPLRNELHAGLVRLVVLEIPVAAALALAHRLERPHPAIELVRTALVENRLARALLGAGEEPADHYGTRAGGERLRHVAGEL